MRLVALLAVLLLSAETSAGPERDELRLPSRVEAINGESIDLAALARRKSLVVVTLKTPHCPVCARQLERLRRRLPELAKCGVTFIVIGPGPAEALAELQTASGFDYPFVEDADLSIARSLGLQLSADEIAPAILMARDDLSIGWIQRGRSARYFGDEALREAVECWMTAQTDARKTASG